MYCLHWLSFPFVIRSPLLEGEEQSQEVHRYGMLREVVEDPGRPSVRNMDTWTSMRYEGILPCAPNRCYEKQKMK